MLYIYIYILISYHTFFTVSAQLIECQNHTVVEFIKRNSTVVNCIDQNQTQYQIIIIISALMNGLLIIALFSELFFLMF